MKELALETDGAARGNPGPAGIGVVGRAPTGEVVFEIAQAIGRTTNNQAEYRALIAGLEKALALGVECVRVKSDSELMVRQMLGEYRVRDAGLKPLHEKARRLAAKLVSFAIVHVPRGENEAADRLANLAIDSALNAEGRAT
ncbi:MAG: ribonuclease HI family protein [Clostridia bacterium]|nr:ribonuclease HI family protein [Clostridia bacterium]